MLQCNIWVENLRSWMHPLYTLTTQTLSHTSDPLAMALPDCSALPEKDSGPHYTTKTAQECQEKHKEYKALIWRKLSQIPIIHRGPSSQPTKLKGSATKALVPDATWFAERSCVHASTGQRFFGGTIIIFGILGRWLLMFWLIGLNYTALKIDSISFALENKSHYIVFKRCKSWHRLSTVGNIKSTHILWCLIKIVCKSLVHLSDLLTCSIP